MQNLKLLGTAALLASLASSSFALVVSSDITANTTWSLSDSPVILTAPIYVTNNAVLTIEAGVIVRGLPDTINNSSNDGGSLLVTRGAQLLAKGTSTQPIVFTTAAVDMDADGYPDMSGNNFVRWNEGTHGYTHFLDADPVNAPLPPFKSWKTINPDTGVYYASAAEATEPYNRGMWGGLVLLGNAPTNCGDVYHVTAGDINSRIVAGNSTTRGNGQADDYFEGVVEGLQDTTKGIYGGTNPNDSSGSLSFVSIRHGGTSIGAGNELNGLTMGGVGYGTKIEYVEVYMNQDDGYEFFGGTVNTRYLVSLFNDDDSFDIDEGFTGLGQFWFSLHLDDPMIGNNAGEHDGVDDKHNSVWVQSINGVNLGVTSTDDDAFGGLPLAFPTIFNATYIGGGKDQNDGADSRRNDVFRIRDSFGGSYNNSIFSDFGGMGIFLENDGVDRWLAGDITFRNNIWYNFALGGTGAGGGTFVANPTAAQFATAGISAGGVSTSNTIAQSVRNNTDGSSNNYFGLDPFSTRRNAIPALGIQSRFNRRDGIDPRPRTISNTTVGSPTATFFTSVGYFGAFEPSSTTLWTDGWTAGSKLGVLRKQ